MKSPHVCSSLLCAAITPCLAFHSSNTRALEKLISCSSEGAGFFCQLRSWVKTIIVGQIVPENIQLSINLHVIFISALSKPHSSQCDIRDLSNVNEGKSISFPGYRVQCVFVRVWVCVSIYAAITHVHTNACFI